VTLPPGVKKIGFYAFTGNELTSVIIGMDVELGGGGSKGKEDGAVAATGRAAAAEP
jgi:hypothetical protein